MTETTNAPAADIRTVLLDQPIKRGDAELTSIQIRKPKAGELRGLSLVEIGQLQVAALCRLMPRITIPNLTEAEVSAMDPADLLACGAEIGRFLLQKSERPAAQNQ